MYRDVKQKNSDTLRGYSLYASKEKIVTPKNCLEEDCLTWALQHSRELFPTRNVWRGKTPVTSLSYGNHLNDIENITFKYCNELHTISQLLKDTNTNAFLVMKGGKIVFEKYYHEMQPHYQHVMMSASKSFVGILAASFAYEGLINFDDQAKKYIPELKRSSYGDATIQQLLDMQVVSRHRYMKDGGRLLDAAIPMYLATGELPRPKDYDGPTSIYELLIEAKKIKEHGTTFFYENGSTATLAWILSRLMNKTLSDVLSEKIWQQMGMEEDAYYFIDSNGIEKASGGLRATLRDVARVAVMILNNGYYNGKQIIPEKVVLDLLKGGNRQLFEKSDREQTSPGYTYRYQWWCTHNAHNAIKMNGIMGQRVYIEPKTEMIIVQFSADAVYTRERIPVFDQAFLAVSKFLK